MRYVSIKVLFAIIFLGCVCAIDISAQTECPVDKVCISREAAQKAIENADKVIALETESKAKDDALAGFRGELNAMRIKFAEVSGENSALRQNAVSDRAIITELLKYTKKRCLPFSVCLF